MKKQRVKSVYASIVHKHIVKLVNRQSVKDNYYNSYVFNLSIYQNNEDGD